MSLVVERLSSGEELLDVLQRRDPRWIVVPKDWVFRGQANSEWSLVPSAFRPIPFRYAPGGEFRPADTHFQQVEAEARIIQRFLRGLDEQGLPFPNEAFAHWIDLGSMLKDLQEPKLWRDWPPRDLAPLVALAQHHQIPTRLLDWTENPLVATYFAALQAAQNVATGGSPNTHFAVWALHYGLVGGGLGDSPRYSRYRLQLVRAPRHSNPNLRAQAGVFTLLSDRQRQWEDPAILPPLDEIVSALRQEQRLTHTGYSGETLIKFEIPCTEAGKLLRYLADEGISGMHLFPGVDGVVRGMREHAFWDIELARP